jgi:Tfp pilus assembly protein PilO
MARTLQSQAQAFARTQLFMGCGLVVLLLGLYLFGFRPASQHAKALRADMSTRQAEFNAAELRARDLKVVELEVEKLQARLERFDKQLPRLNQYGQEVGKFIGDITQLSERGSLHTLKYEQGFLEHKDLYSQLPFSLKFEGDFVGVAAFLQQAEVMPRLARVQKLTMKSKDSKMGQVQVQVSMNLYFADE